MSLWEYKVISSGKGGFATPVLLEKFLNDLGREEWEIVEFRTAPDNPLAFSGLARRSTQRDWTLEDAAAAAARAEADKLRAEFEAKFKAATSGGAAAAEPAAASFIEEKIAPDDGFRKPVDTSHDAEPEDEEEAKAEAWDKLGAEDEELPTFFDAIRPHLRKNQRGAGMSVGVDYLAKKWDQSEDDLKGALLECGFVIPEDEDAAPVYLEYDGDLYWVNVNRRGELWINTKEKPRQVFKTVKAQRVTPEEQPEQKPEAGSRKPANAEATAGKSESAAPQAAHAAIENRESKIENPPAALPAGSALLDKIRPLMRRNRRGPGGSGSTSFLSRALKRSEADLKAAFSALGLALPASPSDKPVFTEIGHEVWWLNLDSRGGLWINGREKKAGEAAPLPTDVVAVSPAPTGQPAEVSPVSEAAAAPAPSSEPAPEASSAPAPESATAATESPAAPAAAGSSVLAGVRLLLKETKTGAIAAKIDRLAEELGKPVDEVVAMLTGAGLVVPEKPRDKPVFVEHAGEIFWFNKNAKDELWLNAKASKFAAENPDDASAEPEKKARRPRGKKKSDE